MSTISKTILMGTILSALVSAAPSFAQDHGYNSDGEKLWSQADQYYDADEMDAARASVLHHNGDDHFYMFSLDRAEVQFKDGEEVGVWDGSYWFGGDVNKLFISTEGEYAFESDEFEEAEVQVLWSRAVSPFFDIQSGIRYDFEPDGLAHAVLGFQGLAPYWFELNGATYLSEEGDLTGDLEGEYELFLTQRLILQPRAELQFSAQDIPDRDIGSGFTNLQAGLRLRYEFEREFAPYVGVEYHSALGDTANMIEAAGGSKDDTVWVIGVRAWF